MPHHPHGTASDAEAEDGHVFVEGPGNIAYVMTPAAADETADRLKASAHEAGRQQGQAGADTDNPG